MCIFRNISKLRLDITLNPEAHWSVNKTKVIKYNHCVHGKFMSVNADLVVFISENYLCFQRSWPVLSCFRGGPWEDDEPAAAAAADQTDDGLSSSAHCGKQRSFHNTLTVCSDCAASQRPDYAWVLQLCVWEWAKNTRCGSLFRNSVYNPSVNEAR